MQPKCTSTHLFIKFVSGIFCYKTWSNTHSLQERWKTRFSNILCFNSLLTGPPHWVLAYSPCCTTPRFNLFTRLSVTTCIHLKPFAALQFYKGTHFMPTQYFSYNYSGYCMLAHPSVSLRPNYHITWSSIDVSQSLTAAQLIHSLCSKLNLYLISPANEIALLNLITCPFFF